MENHRLKPMKSGYNSKLFNQLYDDTEILRKKLASQIDSRRFGVSDDIILSWFDDKFIYAFNSYFDRKDPDLLKGYIIKALQTFKFRILRKAYTKDAEAMVNHIELDGEMDLLNIIPDSSEITSENLFLGMALEFLKEKLCDDAYFILQIELNPPPYILDQLNNSSSRIPSKLLADYIGIETDKKNITYINQLRKEIKEHTTRAREYFQTLALSN